MTIAQIIHQHQGGRHLAERGVVAAEAAEHARGGFFAIMADGARIHSDHFQARAFSALAALAAL